VSRATVGAPRSVSSRADGSPASGGKCFIMITREEAKAARKLLCWSQMLLAIEADVSLSALVGFERGQKLTRRTTVLRVQRAFERGGGIFLDDGPVRAPYSAAAERLAPREPRARRWSRCEAVETFQAKDERRQATGCPTKDRLVRHAERLDGLWKTM